MRIIFVCTGNTCRSPMAEKIFKSMVDESVIVESRGVMCREHMPMALNARVAMAEMGLDTSHESKAITIEDIKGSDYVITMTREHKAFIESVIAKADNVYAIADITGGEDIIDPYGGDIEVYRACANLIKSQLVIVKQKLDNMDKKAN